MASKLTTADIAIINRQSDVTSLEHRTNYATLKNKINEIIDDFSAVSIGTTNAETTAARPYHTSLKNRLDSIWSGQANYVKDGGAVTVNGGDPQKFDITAGEAKITGIDVKWSASTTATIAYTSTNTRFDIIVANSDSTLEVLTGTESADPVYPSVATTQKPLARLTVGTASITITDCRDWGAYYRFEGAAKYNWKIQGAVDDISGTSEITEIIAIGEFYEEVDLSGEDNIYLNLQYSKLYRINSTSYCIVSDNTVSNETTNTRILYGDFYGNSKAGTPELIFMDYADNLIIHGCRFDGNSSSTATYPNMNITNCDNVVITDNIGLTNTNFGTSSITVYDNYSYNRDFDNIDANTIDEETEHSGVTIENTKLKDGNILQKLIDTFTQLDSSSVGSPAGTVTVAALTETTVAIHDSGNDNLAKYSYSGGSWTIVGNALNISGAGQSSICALGENRIAYFDVNRTVLETYDFDGTDWAQVGNDLSIAGATSSVALTALTSTRIAMADGTTGNLIAYDFDGTDWSAAGSSFALGGFNGGLSALGENRVIVANQTASTSLKVFDFDETNWAQVGSTATVTGMNTPRVSALSTTRFAYYDIGNDDLRVYEFFGNSTITQINSNDYNTSGTTDSAVASLTGSRVAFIELGTATLRTLDITYFNNPPSPAF